jgi:hypothetical protein
MPRLVYAPAGEGEAVAAAPVQPPAATSEHCAYDATPANFTFGVFSDPDGLIAGYSSEIVNVSGTASASGTGRGAYSYSGVGAGSAFVHVLHALDADDNILATAVHAVAVADLGGTFDWVQAAVLDFAAATIAGPWTTGTQTITGAAASTIGVIVTRSSTTDGTVAVTADGLDTGATSGGGNINSVVDLQPYIGADNAWFTAGPGVVVVQACYSLAQLGGSGAYWAAGVTNKTLQGQAFCGVACNWSAGNVVVTTYYDTVSGVTLYSGPIPTEWRLTVMVYQGRTSRVLFEPGVAELSANPPASGYSFTGQPVLAANTAQFFGDVGGADFGWLTSVRSNGSVADVTCTGMSVWRMEDIS